MITPLKHWSLNRTIPTIDDTESLSVLELVGKNTTKINEIVKDYNSFVDKVNETIEDFETSINKDYECFKEKITKIVHDYIEMLDEKIKLQDSKVAEAVKYMKENIKVTTHEVIQDMKENGELTEVIMNVFNEILEKITEIETNITLLKSELETKIIESETRTNETLTGHDNRIKNLEDTKPTLIYNASEKGLTITNLGGVENE